MAVVFLGKGTGLTTLAMVVEAVIWVFPSLALCTRGPQTL